MGVGNAFVPAGLLLTRVGACVWILMSARKIGVNMAARLYPLSLILHLLSQISKSHTKLIRRNMKHKDHTLQLSMVKVIFIDHDRMLLVGTVAQDVLMATPNIIIITSV